ncbi:MAG: type IX secretion system protein PorQ [Microbacter sp.]
MKNKRFVLISLILFTLWHLKAQTGNAVYSFLDLPASAHLAAMGGTNVSLSNMDVNFAFNNPALLNQDTKNTLGLNYTSYLAGIGFGSAIYGFNMGEQNFWAIGIRFVNYGQFQAYSEVNQSQGTFTAQDYALNVIYARQLNDQWNIGIAFQPIYSHYDVYSSLGLSSNVGIHFHDDNSLIAFGVVAKNIGTQITSFDAVNGSSTKEALPFVIECGFTKKFEHAPIQFTLTGTNLQKWNLNYSSNTMNVSTKVSFANMLMRHLLFAVDLVPNDHFYLSFSYNNRRANELNIANTRSLSGFSGGIGFNISHVQIGFAVAEYQIGNLTYHFSLSTHLSNFGIQ